MSCAASVDADPRRRKALTVLGLVQLMLVLDVTVVNVALPYLPTYLPRAMND
jgi:hypothetical protein